MKAIEFVKKHGWEAVINAVKSTNAEETACFESKDLDPILSKSGEIIGFNVKIHQINYNDVKEIVDAYELVFEHGSIERAKKYADSAYTAPEIKTALDRAINLVGQCQ